ncbi:hypothetical protein WJX77_012290 [Trebouxia sp. C0004]
MLASVRVLHHRQRLLRHPDGTLQSSMPTPNPYAVVVTHNTQEQGCSKTCPGKARSGSQTQTHWQTLNIHSTAFWLVVFCL